MKNKITAIVLTFNEERQIRDCLESIKWVDEIVVIDSFSTDRTVEICKKYTDKIYQREYQRYARTRNWSLKFASFDWILAIDADERYIPELEEEIRQRITEDTDISGYFMPIRYFCFGKELKHWRKKEHKLRLFKKDLVMWEEREVHPRTIVKGKKGYLKSPFLHYSYPNLKVFFDKFNRYTSWDAEERIKTETKVLWFEPIVTLFKPGYNFISYYLCQSVYKDSFEGFFMSILMSFYTFAIDVKYYLLILKGIQKRWMCL